jgi:uncharacterized protein (TIGR02147 family)
MTTKNQSHLNIKEFQSPVQFLTSYYAHRKSQDSDFSYETWSQEIGFHNRSYLRFVVLGHRPISEKMMALFLDYFKFSTENGDAEYFETLVHFSQSKTKKQKQFFGKRLLELATPTLEKLEVTEHFEFLSDRYLPVIQTICGFVDVQITPEAISALLDITVSDATAKINALEQLGLVKNGVPQKRAWRAGASYQALGHREFYKESLQRASAAIDLPFNERRFRSLFVALSPDEFQGFLKDFEVFAQEQLVKNDKSELSGRRVYQLNFNFFPETKSKT